MTLAQYLEEDGTGAFADHVVHDLVPSNGMKLDLLLVLESPHIDELRTGVPLSGEAGQSALAVLKPKGPPPEALAPFLAALHRTGNGTHVGIINVSRVPLQLGAFKRHRSRLAVVGLDWALMEKIRDVREDRIDKIRDRRVQSASQLLLPGLQARLSQLRLAASATVVPAGKFAQRYWNSLAQRPRVATLPVPHPSNGWWTRPTVTNQDRTNLAELKRLFELHTP